MRKTKGKQKRGGARPGAGRKRLLPEDRILRSGFGSAIDDPNSASNKWRIMSAWKKENKRFGGPDCTDCCHDAPKTETCVEGVFRPMGENYGIFRLPKKGCSKFKEVISIIK